MAPTRSIFGKGGETLAALELCLNAHEFHRSVIFFIFSKVNRSNTSAEFLESNDSEIPSKWEVEVQVSRSDRANEVAAFFPPHKSNRTPPQQREFGRQRKFSFVKKDEI